MRVVIAGAGRVGAQLAKYLIQEKHDVSVIEANEEQARHISNRLDCLVIHDEGNNLKALADAGIANADALVCVTGSDEINMIICSLASLQYPDAPGAKKLIKIACIKNDEYINAGETGGKHISGIDYFINPNTEAAKSVIKTIEHGVLGDVLSIPETNYELGSIDITAASIFDGLALADYRSKVQEENLVTLIVRNGEILLPSGKTVLHVGDRIYILADKDDMPRICELAGNVKKPIRKIGIVGGGELGSLIAEGLLRGFNTESANGLTGGNEEDKKRNVFFPLLKWMTPKSSRRIYFIEQDYRLCKELAVRFPETLILNEDITDENFINDEHLNELDLLITTTDSQEFNIITAVYLKSRGVQRTIAMVTAAGYAAMARRLGVDVAVPLKSVVVDSILSRLMSSSIKEVHHLEDGTVDIMEIEIGEDAALLNKPISQMKLSEGGLIMLVSRGSGSFIPGGDYIFCPGDRITLISKSGSQAEIDKYFGANK